MTDDLRGILGRFRAEAKSEREKGAYFEQIAATYLRHDPLQKPQFSEVETFGDWAKRRGEDAADSGIDLVATLADGSGFCAVQCKFYGPEKKVDKADIDSFFTASGKTGFVRRLIIDTSDGNWTDRAEKALAGQSVLTQRIGLSDLSESPIEWGRFAKTGEVRTAAPKSLRPHQREALEAVREGLAQSDRGKMIMACGTGKTFTALRIAEDLVGAGGMVLFMVPSLALMSQAVREWTNDAAIRLRSFAVCSDEKVGKRAGRADTADIAVHDLSYPATTNGARLAEQLATPALDAMTVVFATYQSIAVLSAAQEAGVGAFDLIICDEAHRTTGVSTGDDDDSAFVRVHEDRHVRGAKRLYMTATPRIYGEAARQRAAEQSITLAQMDDPAIYGETLFERGFSWAVENDLLTDYRVIVLAVDEGLVARSVQRRLAQGNELRLDDATKIIGCFKALAKLDIASDVGADVQPMNRALAFCRDIKSSKIIEAEFAAVVDEYRGQAGAEEAMADLRCDVRHVDGTFNAESRSRLLDWLKTGEDGACRILTNAKCLSEGVDVPALDAILFLHPRKSQIDVVQSVGRVMRRAPGKRMGYVILPVGIPAGQSPEEALNDNERFRIVWQILNALRSHDERLDGAINQMGLGQDVSSRIEIVAVANQLPGQRGEGDGPDIGRGSAPDDEDQAGGRPAAQGALFVDEFAAAVRARIVRKCGSRDYWEDWASDVADIARKHIARIRALVDGGDADVRATFDEFMTELRDDLNSAITEDDAIEMLAQHIITRPVFETLFEGNAFAADNPVSRAMQGIVDRMDEARISKEAETLDGFYASVRRRAQGLSDPAAKQQLVVQLYDRFFKTAFPRTTRKMGVVYTPIEIVDFILRSVDETLRRDFGQGIGAKGVHVIDPFTGTGTFIARLLQSGLIAPEDLERKYREELHANEVILLAYYIAAINIETAFQGLAQRNEYLPFEGICLTDTFALHEHRDMLDAIMPDNSERRSRQRDLDIRVIVGNPPYVGYQDFTTTGEEKLAYPKLEARIRNTYAARSDATYVADLYNSYVQAIRWASDRLGADGGVIAFVTNGGFLDGNATSGLRRCLIEEFSDIRIFDLRGNQRTSGERSKREGGQTFGSGSRAPIAITVLTRRPDTPAAGAIYYHDVGDYLTREQKLRIVRDFGSIGGVEAAGGWTRIEPDNHGDWLSQRDVSFDAFLAMGDKTRGGEDTIFDLYSLGVVTNRDAWAVNSSQTALAFNIRSLIDSYSETVARFRQAGVTEETTTRLRVNDPRKIAWTRALARDAERLKPLDFDSAKATLSTYRPFTPRWLYFDPRLNEMVYRIPAIFPDHDARTPTICLSAVGHKGQFSVLMVDRPPSLHTADMAGSQCFPLEWWEMVGEDEDPDEPELILVDDAGDGGRRLVRRDGITDAGLAHFRAAYPGEEITKEDLFFYVYGLLHAPDYRARYADNLKKALPRIPAVASINDFRAFADAGRRLADLHMNYDAAEPFPATYEQGDLALANIGDPDNFYRVDKMRFGGRRPNLDRTRIIYNANLTLTGVPPEAYDYVVNGKSAIEHVMERQSVSVDRHNPQTGKGSDIVNDPNRFAIETMGDPAYPLLLLRRVITISLETVRIVNALPPLRLTRDGQR